MGEACSTYQKIHENNVMAENPERKGQLGRAKRRCRILLKRILRKQSGREWTGFI
jgi:hypothetical protein